MSKKDPKLLIEDMLICINKIESYLESMDYNSFTGDNKTIDAVIRNFEIIGEAANKIPKDYNDTYRDIEWRKIIGLRNRVIHDYFGVDLEIIWFIYKNELKDLKKKLRELL